MAQGTEKAQGFWNPGEQGHGSGRFLSLPFVQQMGIRFVGRADGYAHEFAVAGEGGRSGKSEIRTPFQDEVTRTNLCNQACRPQ